MSMKKTLFAFVILVFCCGCNERSAKPTNENVLTEKEVRDFVRQYDDIWAKRDTTGMKRAMAENYIYFTSTGRVSTRDMIISWFTPDNKYKVDTAIRSEISVTLNENVATVISRWIGSGSYDGERFKDDQRCSLTIQKINGELKLIAEHCTQIVTKY